MDDVIHLPPGVWMASKGTTVPNDSILPDKKVFILCLA